MKLTILLLFIAFLHVHAGSFAQKNITLNEKNASLQKVLKAIKNQSGYNVFFIQSDLKKANMVSIDIKDMPLTEALNQCFKNQPLTYSIQANTIVVKERPTNAGPANKPEQSAPVNKVIDVIGTIVDEIGKGIPGASIKIKGREQGTMSDESGNFKLTGVADDAILVISYLGYQTKEIKASATVKVTLLPQSNDLSEVVVVAYGTQKKSSLTGAIATITPKQLKERPVTSIQNALQGISPGLTILQRPGDVSASATGGTAVNIRGRSSLAGAGTPLYIIDGIPASSQEFATLNPNDISGMSVLKDASSAALYGSRAANGVIMVTTKRGGGEKATIEFNANYGWQSPTRIAKYLGSVDYTTLYNEALTNVGRSPMYTPAQIELYRNGSQPDLYPNTDWYKEVLRPNAPQGDVNLNINAPGKITSSYLGLNYLTQESLIPNKDQDRFSAKLNTETKVIENILKIGTNISFINQAFDRLGNLSWTELNRSLPTTVFRQSNGQWGSVNNGTVASSSLPYRNQARMIAESSKGSNRNNLLQTAANATLTPLKGLSINGLVSLKFTNNNSTAFNNTMAPINNFLTGNPIPLPAGQGTQNDLREYWSKRKELLVQATADYERTFGKHYGKVTVGSSQESNVLRSAFLGRRNFPNNDLSTIINGSGNGEDILSDNNNDDIIAGVYGLANRTAAEEWAMRSMFGRFNYAFEDKYLLEVNARIDYSSRFREDVRRAFFPSFSAGWVVSKEDFMKNINWVDNLKLRGSYGSLGNQDVVAVGNYFNRLNSGFQYSFEGTAQDGIWQADGSWPTTTWEKVYMTDFGADMTLFKGKLDITADYYIKDTKDLLLRNAALATYPLTVPFTNAASTRNTGFELAVTHNNRIGKDFTFSVGGNLSLIKSKITKIGDNNNDLFADDLYIQRVGESLGSFYGYIADGLFVSNEEVASHAFQDARTRAGDIKYRDINGDNVINAADRTIIGNDVPFVNYGFNLSAAYKGFDFNILTYGVAKVKTFLGQEASTPFFNGANAKVQLLNRWTKENPDPNADFPRTLLTADAGHNINQLSSFYLFSGSYFRVRGITLGYTLPQNAVKKIGLSKLRIYGTANNPFTIMADKRLGDYDPESASGRGGYPGIKTWSFGLSAGL
ncbi:TonB-linked SusC/RagA family outer membrane protein [Pedobacter sp. AK013]|uniref:TonB-dependent receptor n=1 Tax=Pedobacter sp. AK013 TaxID=2723071 RepID=UPI00161E80B6|nr:TonB-dependent receptor [Pedobacter sp. AK013]MBB6237461.1 TonB-linked SusC/RagA family outer membrane protein [Pedobacter sp. AK013]